MSPGHVFVVHCRMQDLQYDAAVVPTDAFLSVRSIWCDVVGAADRAGDPRHLDVEALRPHGWDGRFGRIPEGDRRDRPRRRGSSTPPDPPGPSRRPGSKPSWSG